MTKTVDIDRFCSTCGALRQTILFVSSEPGKEDIRMKSAEIPACPECGDDSQDFFRQESTPAD